MHNCPRCGYNTNHLITYKRHLMRIKICEPKISKDDLQEEYIKYNIIDKIITLNEKLDEQNNINYLHKNTLKIPKNTHENNLIYSKNTQKIPINFNCDYCGKNLSSYKSLWRHLKSCKEKIKTEEANTSIKELVDILNKQIEEQKIFIEEQKKEIEKKELEKNKEIEKRDREIEKRNKQIDELIKKTGINNSNNITTNIQNNIKLLAYKDTDISKITDTDLIKCINHNNMCIPQLIKMIHLDPQKPENHNIYISNLKNGYIMLYDGKKWNTLNRDDTIINLIDEKQNIIEEKIEDWVTKGKEYPELMKKFKRYLDKKENNEVLNKRRN